MTGRRNPDVIIIGGGINGVNIAFQLAKKKIMTTLLEKSFIAGGPTGWSSAIIRQHYSNPVTARMALNSLRFWQNFSEIVGGDAGFNQTGFLIGVTPADVDGLKSNLQLQQSLGIHTQFVSPDEIKEIEPHLDPTGLGGFAYEPEGGYCDPTTATNSLAVASEVLGVTIRTGVTVKSILVENDRLRGVNTSDGPILSDVVVVAAGPWSTGLMVQLGIELPIITARIKVGLYLRPVDFTRHRIFGDFINQIYVRPETGKQMLVGSISPDEIEDRVENPDAFNEKVDLETLADFAERSANRYPAMQRGHLASHFVSLYDITPDWHPILDSVSGIDGLYVCAGTSGHGFKLSPSVGEMMANLILHGKHEDDDIHLFALDRFSRHNLVRGQYSYSILG